MNRPLTYKWTKPKTFPLVGAGAIGLVLSFHPLPNSGEGWLDRNGDTMKVHGRRVTYGISLTDDPSVAPVVRPSVTRLLNAAGQVAYPETMVRITRNEWPNQRREMLLNEAAKAFLARERRNARKSTAQKGK